jgi:nucleotide-binding universal stress UspA family protein
MFEVRSILFATDFGEAAKAALPELEQVARRYDAEVVLVHALPGFWKDWLSSGLVEKQEQERLESWANRLEESGIRARAEAVLRGNPAEVIVTVADRMRPSLVMIGAGDASRIERRFIGSTAESVVRHAAEPVWVAKPKPDEPLLDVLCGVDGSAASGVALAAAASVCQRFDGKLTVISALHGPDFNPMGMSKHEIESEIAAYREQREQELDAFIEERELGGVEPTRLYEWGLPAEVLLSHADDEEYDLMVVGRSGRTGLRRVLLGGTAERVMRRIPCSLLVLPAPA